MGRAGNPGPELVEKMVESALKQFDARHGGFGSQPKFPHSGAVDLLIDVASRVSSGARARPSGDEAAKQAALLTLDKMAKGGIYDHLAGGFHRYSRGRALGGAALREDGVRQQRAAEELRARLPDVWRAGVRAGGAGDRCAGWTSG